MARNQLTLAHNGNVNSPELLSPTQGEIWLGAGCILPNPNSERELARLKSCPPPLLCSSLERFTALPIYYSSRSSKQVSPSVWKTYLHTYKHTCCAYTHSRICRFSRKVKLCILWQMTSSMDSVAQLPQNVTLNLTWTLPFSDATFTHFHIFIQSLKGYRPWRILQNHFSFMQHWDLFDRDIILFFFWAQGKWWKFWLTCYF